MTLEKQIKSGVDQLVAKSAKTSKNEPNLAIAQLLLSAAILAQAVDMSADDFLEGVHLAMSETCYRD